MPVQTYVQDGCVIGYLPGTGHGVRVSLAECARQGGLRLTPQQRARLDRACGATIDAAVGDTFGSGVGASGFGKAVKKIAKSKVLKGITSVVAKAVPAPFNLAITASQGAAKFAKSIKAGKSGALALKGSIGLAAKGLISPAKLRARAGQFGVDPKEAEDAALIKRVALESTRNPLAKAALRLASDLTDSEPVKQSLALASALNASNPNAQSFVVQAPGGQHWRTTVELGAIELGAIELGARKPQRRGPPPPAAKLAVRAVPSAKSFRARQKRGHKGARALQPHVTAAARGTITPGQLSERARKAGVPPKEAEAAALIERMRLDASDGDTAAQSAVKAAESVARGTPPASALAETGPDADAPEADFDDDGQADELPEADALESDE